ncbi:hypothetical protein RIF29_18495 [Crotalaria pallida]|uniref:Uncharacterized protein n=1 Tax=Crotalaria pallida TaxID=3830 RepID=A0AAN9IG89_CROPI
MLMIVCRLAFTTHTYEMSFNSPEIKLHQMDIHIKQKVQESNTAYCFNYQYAISNFKLVYSNDHEKEKIDIQSILLLSYHTW